MHEEIKGRLQKLMSATTWSKIFCFAICCLGI